MFQPLLEGLDLGLPLGELSLQFVDAGLRRGAVHGLGDLFGLAVERLPRLLTVLGHLGDIAVLDRRGRRTRWRFVAGSWT